MQGQCTCRHCGAEFVVAAWRIRKGEGKFCSRSCRDRGAHVARTDADKKTSSVCPRCGTTITYYKHRPRTYCSNACAGRAIVGNIRGWAPSAFTATCEHCRESFETTPKRTRGRFCSLSCYGAWMAGGHAPTGGASNNWRGGYLPYYGGSWRRARRQARDRDGACVDCGITPSALGKSLDVHHIVPFRLFGVERHREANDLANLVALCPACHQDREWGTNRRHR